MICPNCGNECAESDIFCAKCGATLPEKAVEEVANAEENVKTEATPTSSQSWQPASIETYSQAETASATQAQTTSSVSADSDATTKSDTAAASSAAATVSASSAAAAPEPQATQAPAATTTNAATAATTSTTSAATTTQPQAATPNPQPTATNAAYTATTTTTTAAQAKSFYAKGCVSAAWDDIKSSEGWFGKTLLLGVIMIVPILNWIVSGYCMRWSRQLILGKIEHMPKEIFGNRNFINGVYMFVISLVFGLVGAIAAGILGFIPILGWIAGIAISIFVSMFMYVASMRAAIADRLGAGFDISQIWQTSKNNLGSLFVISFVPSLIIGLIIGLIGLIIASIAFVGMSGDILNVIYAYDMYDYYDYYYSPEIISSILGLVGMAIPAFLLIYIIGCFGEAFAVLLTYRAMGHWVARYASDWMSDPTITATAFANQ